MTDPTQLMMMAAMLMFAGGVAGVLAGLLGVGGGIVLVPSFYYIFTVLGYESTYLMQICLATSLATIIVTSCRSVLSHNRKGAVEWQILKNWAPGIIIGACVGVLAVSALRSTALQVIFGILATLVGLYMSFGRNDLRIGDSLPVGAKGYLFSPVIGFLSVLMGIGGGSFAVPTMTLFGVPVHRAVATAAGVGVIIAVPSVIGFLFVSLPPEIVPPYTIGTVNLPAFAVVITMTLMFAPLGVAIAHKTDPGRLKKVFGVFLILVALNMLRKAVL